MNEDKQKKETKYAYVDCTICKTKVKGILSKYCSPECRTIGQKKLRAISDKKYREANVDKIRIQRKEYNNRPEVKARRKQYYLDHGDKIKANTTQWQRDRAKLIIELKNKVLELETELKAYEDKEIK